MNTPSRIRKAAEATADKLMRDLRGVKAVVIATEDGFEVAGRMEEPAHIGRLAALASSLAALGALAGDEGKLGECDNVGIEAALGHLLMVRARNETADLIICILSSRDAVIGQVLYMAKQAARELRRA